MSISKYVWPLFLCLLLTACEHRMLVERKDYSILKVRLITDSINNVTCNIYNGELEAPVITSDVMRTFVYDYTGTSLLSQGFIREKSIDAQGNIELSGYITLSPGNYRLLSYNFDLESTYINGEGDYNNIYSYTNKIPDALYSRFGSMADKLGTVYYQPEHLLVACEPQLTIEEHNNKEIIEMDAHTVVETYYIQIPISSVENMAANAACSAILSGLAPSTLISQTGGNSKEQASVYFELQRGIDPRIGNGKRDILCATFNTFWRAQDATDNLKIILSVLTRDGKTHQKEIDMSYIFKTEDARRRNWLLIDEIWSIPHAMGNADGGFVPKVEDWDDIEETIPI